MRYNVERESVCVCVHGRKLCMFEPSIYVDRICEPFPPFFSSFFCTHWPWCMGKCVTGGTFAVIGISLAVAFAL